MKRARTFILSALICVAGSAMAAPDVDALATNDRVLRVFVHVDAKGEVIAVDPAVELQAGLEQALRQTLDRLISKPAIVDHKPAASQLVMDLALKSTLRADGGYDASFEYLSSQVVPSGSWHWVHAPGRAPVLVPKSVTDYRHDLATRPERAQEPHYYGLPGQ